MTYKMYSNTIFGNTITDGFTTPYMAMLLKKLSKELYYRYINREDNYKFYMYMSKQSRNSPAFSNSGVKVQFKLGRWLKHINLYILC